MDYENSLKNAGLTGNESLVYLELLKNKALPANQIAKKLSLDRTLTYSVLNHLIDKGLVVHIIKEGKKHFQSTDPSNLLNPIKEKESFVKNLITELGKVQKKEEIQQEVNIYEGKNGMRAIMNLVLKHNSLSSFGATGRAYDLFYESPAIVKQMIKKGFKGRIITSLKYKTHPMVKIKNIETRYLSLDSNVTTSIFGDYVLIHIAKEKPSAILIKNKEIAESYLKHFEILWKVGEK